MKKKIFATLLAAVMTIASTMTAFAADTYTGKMTYTGDGWWPQGSVEKEITGEGDYTFTYTGDSASAAFLFYVDIIGAGTAFANYEVKNITVKTDGNAVGLDSSKVVYGDLENNGNFRIEIYNAYGSTASNPPATAADLAFTSTVELSFTLNDPSNDETTPTPTESTPAPTTSETPAASSSATPNNQDTGDVADYTMVVAMLALAAAGVLYFNKRIITEK